MKRRKKREKKRKKTEHTIISLTSQETQASKYSRHVVFCKKSKKKTSQPTRVNVLLALIQVCDVLFDKGTIKKEEKREKKTEHTIISHTSRNSEHQNIHVMLSYAKKATIKEEKNNTKRLNISVS